MEMLPSVEQAVERTATTYRLGEHKPHHALRLIPNLSLFSTDGVEIVSILDIEETVEWDRSGSLDRIEEADGSRRFIDLYTTSPSERHCQLPVRTRRRVGRIGTHRVAVRSRIVFVGFRRPISRLGRVVSRTFGMLKSRLGRFVRKAPSR